jgi:hypothetical protein
MKNYLSVFALSMLLAHASSGTMNHSEFDTINADLQGSSSESTRVWVVAAFPTIFLLGRTKGSPKNIPFGVIFQFLRLDTSFSSIPCGPSNHRVHEHRLSHSDSAYQVTEGE